jgi:hypothetical protein
MTAELERRLISQIRYQACCAIWYSVGEQVDIGLYAQASQRLRDYLWSQVGGRILNQVFEEVWSVMRLQYYEEHDAQHFKAKDSSAGSYPDRGPGR